MGRFYKILGNAKKVKHSSGVTQKDVSSKRKPGSRSNNSGMKAQPVNYGWNEPESIKKSSEEPPASPKNVLSDFCDYTSTHGPSHVKRVKNIFGKLVWLVAILTFSGVLTWQLVILIKHFMRSDYNVLLEVKFNKSLPFPAVTFCNLNPYRNSKFTDLVEEHDQLKQFFEKLIQDKNMTSEEFYEDYYDYWDKQDIDYYDYEDDYEDEQNIKETVNTLNQSTKSYIGHKLQGMLLSCTYAGKSCSIKNFTETWNFLYGNCFTFYGEHANVRTAGPVKGLEIELYVELDEYMPSLSKKAGFKVLVHEQKRVPFPDKDGISISTGFSTEIGMRMLEVQRLGSPYYDCLSQTTGGKRNIYSHLPNYRDSYSMDVCEISCYQYSLIKNCECVDSTYPTDHPDMPANVPFCFVSNPICALLAFENYTNGVMECKECLQACSETKFYTTLSSAIWPTPHAEIMQLFEEELANKRNPGIQKWLKTHENMSPSERINDIRNNVARIVLYYEDLNFERIKQTPAYTTISFISNLGGLFGLWVGMSVLSLCEWLEFLLRIAMVTFRRENAVQNLKS